MRKISKLIVHCSDSPDDLDIGFQEINDWHKERGWLSPSGVSCGYHYIIRKDGRVHRGRPDSETGAHVSGHNKSSIGICWVGRKILTPEQYNSLLALITGLRHQYSIPIDKVFGHYELDPNKTCPNLDMHRLRANLLFCRFDHESVSNDIYRIKEQSRAKWTS